MKRAVIPIALASIVLTSCTVGPKYNAPPAPSPSAYKETPPASYQSANGWTPAHPEDSALRGKWWELFGDSDLNALEDQVDPANQTLKVAAANYQQARANIRYSSSALYPTVGTAPSIASEHLSANQPYRYPGRDTAANFVLPVDMSYEVDLWGRIRRAIEAAKEQAQASAADLETVKLSLHAELAIDYFDARSLDEQKRILDDTLVAYTKALELTRNRFTGGIASKAEVAQAQTQLDTVQAQDIDVGVSRTQYEHAIAVLIGKAPEDFSLASKPLPESQSPPIVPVGVPSQLLQRRPDIATAERQVAVANQEIGIARAAFFPQLLLSATGGLQGSNIANWFNWPSRFWAVGPQLAETIFDGGRRRAEVESAQAGYDDTVGNYRQTTLNAFEQVEDNLSALRILEQESAKQHEATLSAEESVQLSTNRYKGGLVTYLEVITAQSIALTNQRTEADLIRRRMEASVLLIKALGGGWDRSKLPS
ncbi:MAG: efflux transporter outer membrane subunit [Bryobacteraceae bacterium]